MSELTPLMSFIERAARDPSFDLVKFEAMLRLQREVERDQQQRAFNAAMAEVQNEIGDINRSGRNPSFNNPYAKLEDLDREARPIYTRHGFSIRYGSALSRNDAPPPPPNHMRMVLIISHRDGFSEEHHLDGPLDTQSGARGRTAIQAVGSSSTYLRRYLLQMVLNLVPAGDPADDDGEATRRQPPPDRRATINSDIPMPPAPPKAPDYEAALLRWDAALAKINDQAGWDKFFSSPAIKQWEESLPDDISDRAAETKRHYMLKLFPELRTDIADLDPPEVKADA